MDGAARQTAQHAMECQYLLETGEGFATITSMPSFFTSGAKLAPKDDRKLFVAA